MGIMSVGMSSDWIGDSTIWLLADEIVEGTRRGGRSPDIAGTHSVSAMHCEELREHKMLPRCTAE